MVKKVLNIIWFGSIFSLAYGGQLKKALLPLPKQTQTQENVSLYYSVNFIYEQVLKSMNMEKKTNVILPEVVFEKNILLSEYKKEVSAQWGFEPDYITNVYVVAKNKIYLIDQSKYYKENERCIDDSLAHELVHFIQVHYQNIAVQDFDDSMEMTAIDIQTQFRNNFCQIQK